MAANTRPDAPLYPDIVVRLTGVDGNTMSILSVVTRALRQAKLGPKKMKEFFNEAISGDHDHAIQTCMKWVTVR